MIQAKCIQKFRDKNNHIIGYRLQDINGQTQDVQADNLKQAIKSNHINILNLTLTKDGRLVDSSEEVLQDKKLGPAPQLDVKQFKDIAKAIVFIEQSCLGMGDDYRETVEYYCSEANIPFDWDAEAEDDNYTTKQALKAVAILLLKNKYDFNSFIEYIAVNNNEWLISQSSEKLLKCLKLIRKYIEPVKNIKGINEFDELIASIKESSARYVVESQKIGYEYWRYLDDKYFGIRTNDYFSTGHKTTQSEPAKKIGSYVCGSLFNVVNKPDVHGFLIGFNQYSDKLRMKIYAYKEKINNQVCTVDYNNLIDTQAYIDYDIKSNDITGISKKLANELNKLAAIEFSK